MARNWIVRGDPTSSGGSVISGSPFTDIDGIAVARITDQATCLKHRGVFPIVEGDATLVVDGQPVALHGSALACGCKVLSAQQMHVFVDAGGGTGGGRSGSGTATSVMQAAEAVAAATAANNRYDEALRFVNAAGAALSGVGYTLFLENGKALNGTTDDDGRTDRVVTEVPERIVRAELKPQETACCPFHAERGGEAETLEIQLDGVITSSAGVGSSIWLVETSEGESRGLTSGEIDMAKLVFGGSVDYSTVKVHNGEYLWFGMQPDDTAMTPNGEMYFNPKHFKEDFSDPTSPGDQCWFMHEMVHVWQHQLGYPVKWRGAVRLGLSYEYVLAADKRLCDYNMEAQGNILADYFALTFLRNVYAMRQANYRSDPNAATLFRTVLVEFLEDPSDKKNLP